MIKINDLNNMTDVELEALYNGCLSYCDRIKNSVLKNCCKKIYSDYKFKFINKPATGRNNHHAFKGGLLHHAYSVTNLAVKIAEEYSSVNVDLDLIIFGALLHDIGKAVEFKDFSDITPEGDVYMTNSARLLGHSYEGVKIVESYLKDYDLDEEFKIQVLHMIGSHMRGFSDWGTLVSPKMLEVIIINHADSTDSELENFRAGLNSAKAGEIYCDNTGNGKLYKSLNPDYKA